MLRRHPILTLLGLLVVAGLLSATFFLLTFDLNRYRDELQQHLSSTLAQPVQLGTASLTLAPGPAFAFTDIRIGSEEDPLLQAEGLALQARLWPLLMGRIRLDKVVLLQPQARFTLTNDESPTTRDLRPVELVSRILATVQVHSLRLRGGSLRLTDLRQQDQPFVLDLTGIELAVQDIYTPDKGHLKLQCQLAENPETHLLASGRLRVPSDPALWRRLWLDLTIRLAGMEAETLCGDYPWVRCRGTRGLFSADLSLTGSPEEGLAFRAELNSDPLLLALADLTPSPLALERLAFSGVWTAKDHLDRFDNLSLHWDGLQFAGHFSLQRDTDDPWIEGGLSSADLPLTDLFRLLPPGLLADPPLLTVVPAGGTLRLDYSRFAGPLAAFGPETLGQTLQDASLQLRDADLMLGGQLALQALQATVTWKDQQLTLSDGSARLMDSPLQFSGSLNDTFGDEIRTVFGAAWLFPSRKLPALLPQPVADRLAANGPVPVRFSVEGPLRQLDWTLQADLQASDLHYRDRLAKPQGMEAAVKLQGRLGKEALHLTGGSLIVGPLKLAARGRYPRTADGDYLLELEVAQTALGRLPLLLPHLQRFALQGTVFGNYRLQGHPGGGVAGQGALQLTDAGVTFSQILGAPLQGFSGTIDLSQDRAAWQNLLGRLGDSPVQLTGRLDKGFPPRLFLEFSADRVAADAAVFTAPEAHLHQLEGRLIFSGQQVDFDALRVTLDDGNRYAVDGRLTLGDNPRLQLEATAERADIDRVLALWQGPRRSGRRGAQGQRLHIVVDSRIDSGSYQQWPFEQGTATITLEDEQLRVDPIHFTTGGGSGQGQVTLQRSTEQPPVLRIEGQLSQVNLGEINSAGLFSNKELLSGTLDGTFHLAGPLGDNFLPKATGECRVLIRDGTLRKFPFLAKVFSLLNVSQLFVLELPDMVSQGMPFSLLEGDFELAEGLLSTENLLVTSNAMNLSLVGTVDLVEEQMDLMLGVKPFGTVDKVITRIPVAGWLLTGEDKALITAHFEITGSPRAPRVIPVPVTSVSNKVLGIFRRVFGLPGKMVTDPREVFTGTSREDAP